MTIAKSGPLTQAELLAIWQGAMDPSYTAPFVAAGDGAGLEAHSQMFAQFARISTAVDVSTQSLFILPHSAQTNPPASGAQFATVTLTFTRTKYVNQAIHLLAGTIFVDEQVKDHSPTGSFVVPTGRRYTLLTDLVFMPGDSGPLAVQAQAEFEGYGYNNPRPNTISLMDQVGSGYFNANATVAVTSPFGGVSPPIPPPPPNVSVVVTAANVPSMFIPQQVGQYVLFTAGANAGSIGLMTKFVAPQPNATPPQGSGMYLENILIAGSKTVTGTFQPGELVQVKAGGQAGAWAKFVQARVNAAGTFTNIALVLLNTGNFNPIGGTLVGQVSGATATLDLLPQIPNWTAEAPNPITQVGGASWIVLDWVNDLGFTVTNAAQPTGGATAMLDALGHERAIDRSSGEQDSVYRLRVHQLPDVVSPNALFRALNRVIQGQFQYCFREAGSALMPGWFYDRKADPNGDFYDDDVLNFTGTLTSGVFSFHNVAPFSAEKVNYQNAAGTTLATGWAGSLLSGNTVFNMIRLGLNTITKVNAGDKIVGATSGAVFTVTSQTVSPFVASHRYRVYLDYQSFRGYFAVCLPFLGLGEFGWAYDGSTVGATQGWVGAYDASPTNDFYDGFPAGDKAIYKQVYDAITSVKAGGVAFDLLPVLGPCT